jgi:hypothetical protein
MEDTKKLSEMYEKLDQQYSIKWTDAELQNYQKKAEDLVVKTHKEGNKQCVLRLDWINKNIAYVGAHPMLSYLVFSPDSQHPFRTKLNDVLKTIHQNLQDKHNLLIAYAGGCSAGTTVTVLRKA